METKEQILNKIKELQAIVDKMPDEPKGLWKPGYNKKYYYVDTYQVKASETININIEVDKSKLSIGNCFKTKEEAEAKLEALQVHQQLKEIAHELNNGVKIDWNNITKNKYYLMIDNNYDGVVMNSCNWVIQANTVYCLSNKFKDVAIERIGKEKLVRYLKEGF